MGPELMAELQAVAERLWALALADPDCRARLRRLGQTLLTLAAEPERPAEPAPTPPPAVAVPAPLLSAPPPAATTAPAASATTLPSVPARPILQVTTEDLPDIRDRCQLKAEGARWAADSYTNQREGRPPLAEIKERYDELIERARSVPDCYLWMCQPTTALLADPPRWRQLAECFEAAVAAADLLYRLATGAAPCDGDDFARALRLAAEAQSALRIAVLDVDRDRDIDQLSLFVWIKETAEDRRIWIERHMRLDDPADPSTAADLRQRFLELETRLHETQQRVKKRAKLLNNLAYKCRTPANGTARDWPRIFEIIEELVASGLPPSDVGLRDVLLPVRSEVPDLPETLSGVRLVLREIDRFLSLRAGEDEEPEVDDGEAPNEEVRQVAELLRGRAVVLIGGTRSPRHAAALEAAFGLSELNWVETREHQTHVVFEPSVARPEVAVVLLMIRWSSHGFGEVKEFCEKYGKPLVHLPRGYNRNQVAHEVLNQAGERLRAARQKAAIGDGL